MTVWRIIPSFPDYAASSNGEIRRETQSKCNSAGKVLRPWSDRRGYPRVWLMLPGEKRGKTVLVPRLVCEAFHGHKRNPLHREVAHNDGDPTNNCAANLRWVSRRENEFDKIKHGTRYSGEAHPSSKLTWADVRLIRAEYTGKRGQADELARRIGTTKNYVRSIARYRVWRFDPLAALEDA